MRGTQRGRTDGSWQTPSEAEQRWARDAWALPTPISAPKKPLAVFEEEVHATVRFLRRYEKPRRGVDDGQPLPALSQLHGVLGPRADEEILELLDAYRSSERRRRMLAPTPASHMAKRGSRVLRELKSVLRYCLSNDTTVQTQLATLAAAHGSARSHAAVAAALFDYGTLARVHSRQIAGVGGFDIATVREAFTLCELLRGQSANAMGAAGNRAQAMALRNRFARLIENRLQAVRAAARFVFRDHPEIVREVTSEYARKQQTAWRAKRRG